MQQALKKIIDTIAAQPSLTAAESDALMAEAFALAKTPEEKREAGQYLRTAISRRKRTDIDVRGILGDAAEFLNLSYIARCYFNKERAWLYQRLNNSEVNGKKMAFTDAELAVLAGALKELSGKIDKIATQFSHQ